MQRLWWATGTVLAGLLACGDDGGGEATSETETSTGTSGTTGSSTSTGGSSTSDGTSSSTSTTTSTTEMGGSTGGDLHCPREPAAADRDRFVVVSKPNDAKGNQVPVYEVLGLSMAGELATTGTTFEMGRSAFGHIRFTADGEIGIVAQSDGTVGVFRLDETGQPEVLEVGFEGSFYAGDVVMGPEHQRVFILDTQTVDNGGGLYELAIDCDANVVDLGPVFTAHLLDGVAWTLDGRPFVGARELPIGSDAGHDAFLLDGLEDPSVLSGADAFGDDEASIGSVVLAAGGRVGILSDISTFSGIPNRLAVVTIEGDTVTAATSIPDLNDPYELVSSPIDDTVLMVSGYGDAILVLDVDPEAAAPVTVRGELAYTGTRPQLPAKAVMLERGSLQGLVLVAENTGVRRVRFEGGGTVTDLGNFDLGDGYEFIVGAVGVQY